MKATPELLQQALRVLEIGLSPEIASKILATVRLLDEKGAEANLMDFALIEACYTEKIERQSEPLPSDGIDLSKSVNKGRVLLVTLRDTTTCLVYHIGKTGADSYCLYFKANDDLEELGWYNNDGICTNIATFIANNIEDLSPYDIVNIVEPIN